MKKIIAFIIMLGLACSLVTVQAANHPGQVFQKNEVALSLYAGISDNETMDVSQDETVSSTSDNDWGLGVAISAFPFQKYAGVQFNSAINDMEGTLFDEIELNGIVRLPLDTKRIAPYVIGGAKYELDVEEWIFGVGPGVEYRMNEKWGVFGEYRYNFATDEPKGRDDEQEARFGLRLVF